MQPPHPDYPRYLPDNKGLRRVLLKLVARLDYEMHAMRHAEQETLPAYVLQRGLRVGAIVRNKSEKVFAAVLERLGREYTGGSEDYVKEMVVGEAHLKAFKTYQPQPYYGKTIIYRTSKQPLGIDPDPTLGWGAMVQGEHELYEISSFHTEMLHLPYVQQMGRHLRRRMDQALAAEAAASSEPSAA
jgi:thioesterase domain-containing protein